MTAWKPQFYSQIASNRIALVVRSPLTRCLVRLASVPLVSGLILGCNSKGSVGSTPAAPSRSVPGSADRPAPVGQTADPKIRVKVSILTKAATVGEAPTDAGVSEVAGSQASLTFFWETPKGRVCLAQAAISGGYEGRRCGDAAGAVPQSGGSVSVVFGPGAADERWMVVLLVQHAHQVTSVQSKGTAVEWKFVRTLAPGSTGRDVYYVLLPAPTGDLDVVLDAGGQQKAERLHFE
ncbi:hypothetical protein [Streptomyces sp. NPDC059874]|uniref:hypothetical protein n=1 Tax=Streptomyces sp. NPDC059874 TaxID=3346983 RepID=UPI003654BA7F